MDDKTVEQADAKPVKYFEDQFDDESVLFTFRKHMVVMRQGLVIASLGLLLGPLAILIWSYVRPNNPPSLTMFFLSLLASLLVSAILFIPAWMSWHFSIFIVTDQRLLQITQRGFFHRSVVDMGLGQIQVVSYEVAGLQETLFGFGTILMQTNVGDLVLHEIPKPAVIQKQLLEALRDQGFMSMSYQPMRPINGTMDSSSLEAEMESE